MVKWKPITGELFINITHQKFLERWLFWTIKHILYIFFLKKSTTFLKISYNAYLQYLLPHCFSLKIFQLGQLPRRSAIKTQELFLPGQSLFYTVINKRNVLHFCFNISCYRRDVWGAADWSVQAQLHFCYLYKFGQEVISNPFMSILS